MSDGPQDQYHIYVLGCQKVSQLSEAWGGGRPGNRGGPTSHRVQGFKWVRRSWVSRSGAHLCAQY